MKPSLGRIVHYILTAEDIARIQTDRVRGNHPLIGEHVPMVIVKVWTDEYGGGIPGVNGQLILDGPDSAWVTSVKEGTVTGTWHWPERED